MSEIDFTSVFNSYDDDGEIITLGFADDEDNPVNYLIVESSYEYDEQEKSLGLDKIYVELNDQSRSTYGGLLKVAFFPNKLIFGFDSTAKTKLQIDGDLTIAIGTQLDQKQVENIKEVFEKEGIEVSV